MSKKTSLTPCIGDDGYYYFTYNQGAEYEVNTGTGAAVYTILDCVYQEESQSYVVGIQVGENKSVREMSLQRLSFLFDNAKSVKVITEGEPKELPVTKAEVELYYARYVKARNKRKREANATLKDDKAYQKLLAEEKDLSPKWAQAICNESADESALEEKMKTISAEKRAILDKLGIKPSDLKAVEKCEVCEDKGVTPKGNICACALAQSVKIKAYCAAERLVEMRIEEQLNETETGENT